MTIAITLLISSAVSFWISSRLCLLNLFDPFLLILASFGWLWRQDALEELGVGLSGSDFRGILWLSPAFERIGPSLPGETNVSKKCFARWKDSGGHCNGMHSHLGSWLLTGSTFVKAYLQLKDKMRTEFAKDRIDRMSGLVERETRPHQVLKNPCVGCSRRCLGIKAACTCERHAQVPFAWFCIAFVWFCLYGNTQYTIIWFWRLLGYFWSLPIFGRDGRVLAHAAHARCTRWICHGWHIWDV